jgi:hypothetical protein
VFARILAATMAAGMLAMSAAAVAREDRPSAGAASEIRTFVLTEERTRTAGQHKPIDNPTVGYGEEIFVYVETEDFGWHTRNGTARFNVVLDAEVRRRDGRLVPGKPEPRTLNREEPTRPDNFFLSFGLKMRLPVGAYQLVVRLRDGVTGKVAEKSFPFTAVSHRPAPTARREPNAKEAPREAASRQTECKKYLPQLGQTVSVPCQ